MARRWQTACVTDAQLTIHTNAASFESPCTIRAVRDSIIVVSITPLLTIEAFRIEITPAQITAIDKIRHQYTILPTKRWRYIQRKLRAPAQIRIADVASLAFSTITYNSPVNTRSLDMARYRQVDINHFIW